MLRTHCSRPSCSSLMAKFCKIGSYLQFSGYWPPDGGGSAALQHSLAWPKYKFSIEFYLLLKQDMKLWCCGIFPARVEPESQWRRMSSYIFSRPDVLVAGPREVLPLMCRHQSCSLGVIIYLQLNIYRYLGPDWITCRWRNKQLSRNWKWGAEARVYSVYCF